MSARQPTVPLSQGQGFQINLIFGPEWNNFLQAPERLKTNFMFDAFDPGLGRVADFLNTDMINRMHYLTGAMVSTTNVHKVKPLEYRQEVPVPYAAKENRRPGSKPGQGPHNFWEPAIQNTISRAIPMLIDELIRYIVSNFGGPNISKR